MNKKLFYMKEKIIAAIKRLFPGVNLSKPRLEKIAAVIEKKVIDDETKIDDTIRAYNEDYSISDIAKEDDAVRDLKAKNKLLSDGKSTDKPKDEDNGKPGKGDTANNDDDVPSWAKTLIETNKSLQTTVQSLQADKAKTSTMDKLNKDLEGIPGVIWSKRMMPATEDEYTAFVADVKADWTAAEKDGLSANLKNLGNPGGGTQTKVDEKSKAVDPGLKSFMDKEKTQSAGPVAGFILGGAIAKQAQK